MKMIEAGQEMCGVENLVILRIQGAKDSGIQVKYLIFFMS